MQVRAEDVSSLTWNGAREISYEKREWCEIGMEDEENAKADVTYTRATITRPHNPEPSDDVANASLVTRTSGACAPGLYFLVLGAFFFLRKHNISYCLIFVFICYFSACERPDWKL